MLVTLLLLTVCISGSMAALGGMVGRAQAAGVRGILHCNGKPEPDVLVKLYDDDRGLDFDDLMGETYTDAHGQFEVNGYNSEISDIDPKFNVYHDCNDWWWPCQRKFSIMIPDEYISSGTIPKRIYDAGVIELSGTYPGESRDCFH
ncbi:hypothetical protein AB6A40_007026 [Gnathostoma spinigerum]|uniref:Transthyretin-like protein 5 n=1 Tax=Gnathostoma spinigerum TaxID=75299 RepID=A0ABD6EUS5_9BILA